LPESPARRGRASSLPPQTNGEEAFDAFFEGKFDLLITDFRMPKMNGIELIHHVRLLQPDLGIISDFGHRDALGLDPKSTGADIVIKQERDEVLIFSVP